MLLGEYEHKIDEKNRLALPPRLRVDFREGGVLSQGLEKCLLAFPVAEWKRLSERFNPSPFDRLKMRRMNRFIFATAYEFELDGQGRVALPLPLRRHAGIKEAVVIAGLNSHLELWSKENWEAERAQMNGQMGQIVESLEFH